MATEVCLQARPADPKGALLIPSPLAWYRARFPTMLYYPARLVFCRLLYVLAMAAAFTAGASVNRTIDDQQGDSITGVVPVFLPSKAWNIGQTCTICAFRPNDPIDVSAVFDGTWHDTTHIGATDPKTIQINFTGHAVYVYHILPNYLIEGIVTSTNLAFYIDNEIVGLYNYTPTGTSPDTIPPIHYRVPVYANDSLAEGEHTLLIGASGETETLILFDYVVYTTEEDSELPAPSSSSSPSSSSHRSQISSSLASLPAPSSTSTRSSQSWTPSPYSANLSMFSSQPLPSESATMDQPSSQSQSPTSFHGSPTSSPRPEIRSGDHTAVIASATAGGTALAMGIVVFCVLCRRRKLHEKRLQDFLSDKDTVGKSSRRRLIRFRPDLWFCW